MNKHAEIISTKSWLFSRNTDLFILMLPVWVCWIICFSLPESVLNKDLPLWFWAVFILGIDVSHVWSTIFRTYLDKEEFNNHKNLLIYTPLVSFICLFLLAFTSHLWYWRVLAYLALYHFIKQQYGFLALYNAKFGKKLHKIFNDKWIIYFSMVYPVIYWHLSGNRAFNWFVKEDFFNIGGTLTQHLQNVEPILQGVLQFANVFYWLIIAAWLAEEIILSKKQFHKIATGKVLWILTTAGNWYLGIVYFNSDIVFSLTNVVAHGIPYIVLILYYVERKKKIKSKATTRKNLVKGGLSIAFMLSLILLLAFGEEYMWDMFLYREKQPLFENLFAYPFNAATTVFFQAFALAMLSIPQVSHYIIDGYIWKGGKKNPYVKKVLID
ncbi:MAG: hypothetical protein CMO01_31635 [Thalassobius sp.]|nr:hypothetical protein [Thalassovita sp.]